MVRPLWQLLLEQPSELTCDECFAVMEYYAELLAKGNTELLPKILEHLKGCPNCQLQHRQALRRLLADRSESSEAPAAEAMRPDPPTAKGHQLC